MQVSLEALGALVPPEEREKAIRGEGLSAAQNGLQEEADVEAEVNEKVCVLVSLYAQASSCLPDCQSIWGNLPLCKTHVSSLLCILL